MRTKLALALIALAASATPAVAVPTAYYNPATGHIWIVSDLNIPFSYIYMKSKTGTQFVTDKDAFAEPPSGSSINLDDLPLGFFFLDPPIGTYTVGNVVLPHTQISDLELGYAFGEFEGPGIVREVPEPASCGLATIALMSLSATCRRRQAQ